MAKKTDEYGVPYPEHERAEWTAPEGGYLEKRIAEVRGVRSYRRNIYRDEKMTHMEASLSLDAPEAVFAQLKGAADSVLADAGEKPYLDTLGTVPESTAPSGMEGLDMGALALLVQRDEICAKYGFISREATASHFITVTDRLGQTIDLLDEKVLAVVTAWADAWYWLRFEESGGHGLAVAGLKALEGRKAGPEAKAKTKSEKEAILRDEFAKLDPRDQWKLESAAFQMMAPLAKRFAEAKHSPYTLSTLKKEITRLKLVKDAKIRQRSA